MATKLNARSKSLKAIRDRHDKELAKIAMESWRWAEAVREPTRMVTKNRTNRRVLGVEEDVRQPRDLREARQVIELLLAGRRPRGAKKDQTRHWAIWRMMNRLLDWSDRDSPGKDVIFPYPTQHSAAVAVVEGFNRAGLDTRLTADRVLKHFRRHFNAR